jgi:hypothetical protein
VELPQIEAMAEEILRSLKSMVSSDSLQEGPVNKSLLLDGSRNSMIDDNDTEIMVDEFGNDGKAVKVLENQNNNGVGNSATANGS